MATYKELLQQQQALTLQIEEARQREIAARHGIRLTNHSLYLYGHCAEGDCREDDHAHDAK